MDTDSVNELRARLRELESEMAELRDVVTETATDNQGREWTIADLVSQFGLTRRQAIIVFGLVASGIPLANALTRTAAAGTDEEGLIGDPDNPADAWLEDVYDKNDNAVMEFPGDGSVSIDEIGNGGSPVSLNDILDFVEGSTGDSFQLYESKIDGTTAGGRYVQFTPDVSTTDVTILDLSAGTTFVGAMAIVIGENDSNSSERFTDAVLLTRNGDATTLGQSESGSPATRSYSVFESTLEISVAANTYSVLAIGDGGRSTV